MTSMTPTPKRVEAVLERFKKKWDTNEFALEDPRGEFDLGDYSDSEKINAFWATELSAVYAEVRGMVPEEKDINADSGAYGWNACRAEMLRRLEGKGEPNQN